MVARAQKYPFRDLGNPKTLPIQVTLSGLYIWTLPGDSQPSLTSTESPLKEILLDSRF